MAAISNRFVVTALQDGQSIQGELAVTRSLWQAVTDGGTVIPNWTTEDENIKPLLYPLIMSGGVVIAPTTTSWKYNNELITFADQTGLSTNDSFPGVFKRTTYQMPSGITVTALRIMKNLASSTNDDSDTITVSGTATVGDTTLSFDAMQTVRITKAAESADVGELLFIDGKGTLSSDTDEVSIRAILHTTGSSADASTYRCEWWWNEAKQAETTGTGTGGNANHTITITGAQVTDYVMVECRFYKGGNPIAVAYIGVEDIADKEMMQFAYAIYTGNTPPTSVVMNNTTAATLKMGQSVLYGVWIGSKDDPLTQPHTTKDYWTWNAKIFAADGTDITQISDTGRKIDGPQAHDSFVVGSTTLNNVATMNISYAKCIVNGGQVSIHISATHTDS